MGLVDFLKLVLVRRVIITLVVMVILHQELDFTVPAFVLAFCVSLLVLLAIDWKAIRHQERIEEAQGARFVTLTESGILEECEGSKVRRYVPWTRVKKGWLQHGKLLIQQETGLFNVYHAGALPRERAEEMLAYVNDHAGKNEEPMMPPPAETLTETPYPISATPKQWREYIDCFYRLALPWTTFLFGILLALCCALIPVCYFCWERELTIMMILLAGMCLLQFLRPGFWAMRAMKNPGPGWVHVTPETTLSMSESGSWTLFRTKSIDVGLQMRHGVVYQMSGLYILLVDTPPEPIPVLPPPRKPDCWFQKIVLPLVLLEIAVASWVLLQGMEPPDTYETARENGAQLQSLVEEVMPPLEYPGEILSCVYYAEEQLLSIDWASGMEVFLSLSPENEEGQSGDCPEKEE